MKYFLILFAFILISCTYQKGIRSNGMTEKERHFAIVQNGGNLSWEMKDHFMRGLPYKGMPVNMIFDMYGEPNFKGVLKRDSVNNDILEYKWTYYNQDRENGWDLKIIVELVFDENHEVISILGEECDILRNCPEDINNTYE